MSESMKMLPGKPLADLILKEIKRIIVKMKRAPRLAVISVGEDPSSFRYLQLKKQRAAEVGIHVQTHAFPANVLQIDLIECITHCDDADGVMFQLPLPPHIDADEIIRVIPAQQNVDSFHSSNNTQLDIECSYFDPVFPEAMMRLIEYSKVDLAQPSVVVGKSEGFRNVMLASMKRRQIDATFIFVTDLAKRESRELLQAAGIVVSAVGTAGILTGDMFRDTSLIIDGGMNILEGKACGDVHYASCEGRNLTITPVPKGVGPVTVAVLLSNVLLAAQLRNA